MVQKVVGDFVFGAALDEFFADSFDFITLHLELLP